ncbi:MAG: 13E12 repeat family protein [Acidimicrobiia bacterium]|nr:13E12 repeat family protein [Acidimicrobiia bacterium]
MESLVADRHVETALDTISAGVDQLFGAGIDPVDCADATALARRLESISRRIDAAQADLVAAIDRRGLHHVDGHGSAKVMVRHVAKLSNAEAAARARTAKALVQLPELGAAYRAGRVGTCQVRRVARAAANPRVADRLPESEARLVRKAGELSYKFFDALVTDWVRRVDDDGTCDVNQRNHENRDAVLIQDFDQSWHFTAGCGALQGAEMRDIFDHFIAAEFTADWEAARAEHGDTATVEQLPRTPGQRRFDAFFEICRRAATAPPGGKRPEVITNIVIDQATYERQLAELAGMLPAPDDPRRDGYRCSTLDGHPVEPTEATAASLTGHVRRVVIGSDSVVIDVGRRQRLFTGSAQLAVRLADTECYWPGCHVPVSQTQTDHLLPWPDRRARTNPRNGGPACGRHNRTKERGFTPWRDPAGQWHVLRPDGTPIDDEPADRGAATRC